MNGLRNLCLNIRKKLKSAEKGGLDLDKIDDKKKDEYSALFDFIKEKLNDKIKDVQFQPG